MGNNNDSEITIWQLKDIQDEILDLEIRRNAEEYPEEIYKKERAELNKKKRKLEHDIEFSRAVKKIIND